MSEFFERNCLALSKEKANQLVLDRIRQVAPAAVDVYETDDGSLGIACEGVALHSSNGAVKEAQDLIEANCTPSASALHLLFGLGLGYPLAELSAVTHNFPDSVILVFEPSLPLLRFVMENVDLAKYCENRRIIINNNPGEFFQLIHEKYVWKKTELDTIILPSTIMRAPDDIRYILKRIPDLIESQQYALQAGLQLSEAWVTHFIKALPYWPETQYFEQLDNIAPNQPVVVVSAGPSLDKTLDDLKRLQDQVMIIAVGRAVRPLMNAGIQPDFIAFIDYEGLEAQLQNLPFSTENSHFLVGPYTEEAILKAPKRSALMVNMHKFPLVPWVDALLGGNQKPVDILGTVSYLGLQAAYTMGGNPVILLGQDLAFTPDKQYAQGSMNSDKQRIEGKHLILGESPSYAGEKIDLVEVQGQSGENLLSTGDYLEFRKSLESFAELNHRLTPERKLFNASVGGVNIAGFENKTLAEIISACDSTLDAEQKKRILDDLAPTANAGLMLKQYAKLAVGVQQLQKHLEALQQCIEKNIAILQKGTDADAWQAAIPAYNREKRELQKLIQADPLISLVMGKPSYMLNEKINKSASSWEEQQVNVTLTLEFLESCLAIFKGDFYRALMETGERLQAAAKDNTPVLFNK